MNLSISHGPPDIRKTCFPASGKDKLYRCRIKRSEYNIGNGEYIREVINNIISHNKDDENEIKILFTINGDRSNIFKIV